MNQAWVQIIIWREAPKKDFLHNANPRTPNKILRSEAADTTGK